MAASLSPKYTLHQYGEHELQRVGVWDLDAGNKAKYWIVYIHGGAWRDPRITHETFSTIVTRIVDDGDDDDDDTSNGSLKSNIAAFASLDYRLSPHPDFPQDPATTPAAQLRGARHPDHLRDVRAALRFLQRRFGFASRYLLLGHSAGGTLACQLLAETPVLSSSSPVSGGGGGSFTVDGDEDGEESLVLPEAIVNFEGIYDFTGLNARVHNDYAGFLTGAFGPPEKWDDAAPVKFAGSYADRFKGLMVLVHSLEDELVDVPEVDGMAERLRRDGVEPLVVKDIGGKHDDIWQDGRGVVRTVERVLGILRGNEGEL
ncbi:hypothetical protein M426DRAFT_324956 [Hypoxylon sp. CI-4A]|nr:hypothetical protein M426DRAFT_324956 [Hypoxylon sp. CI-4A]